MKIIVTGATGLIGRKLIYKLQIGGHEVKALARSPQKLPELPEDHVYTWIDSETPKPEWFSEMDAVIHLAGEGIADKYWTENRKQKIWKSRVEGTKNIINAIEKLPDSKRPKILISSSAIGIYGDSYEEKNENSLTGRGFLSELCMEWEKQANQAQSLGIRTVILRTGLVLSKHGGVLSKTGPVILGSGKQWMSWIHIDDHINFVLHALENRSLFGPFNLTAPHPVTNREFTKTFSKELKIPVVVQIPAVLLKVVLGELSSAILSSQKVIPHRAMASGFKFKYEKIEEAIKDLLGGQSFLSNFYSAKQFVPKSKQEVFSFFSTAENLEVLTPPWLNFHIIKKSTDKISEGSLIDYKLKIHKVPIKWRTLISRWNPENFFVDEQIKGPYKKWHHTHTFESVSGGTLISDDVIFQLPAGLFGKMLLPLVKKDVEQIFKYRQEKIKSLYQQRK